MPINAASGTSADVKYNFPKGKPGWLLIRSSKKLNGKSMDSVYRAMASKFSGKIHFRTINLEDPKSQPIIAEHSLDAPPASVLADAQGHIVQKFEGPKSSTYMEKTLRSLLAKGKKR